HAEAMVRAPRVRDGRVSGRLRHDGRGLRNPDPIADAQADETDPRVAVRRKLLAGGHRLRSSRTPRHDRRARPRALQIRRYARERARDAEALGTRGTRAASACVRQDEDAVLATSLDLRG